MFCANATTAAKTRFTAYPESDLDTDLLAQVGLAFSVLVAAAALVYAAVNFAKRRRTQVVVAVQHDMLEEKETQLVNLASDVQRVQSHLVEAETHVI